LFTADADSAENLNEPEGSAAMQIHPDTVPRPDTGSRTAALARKATELEAAFLAEMLSHAGLGKAREGFGGGIGEDQFASFLRNEQASAMAAAGGIGLAEHLFRSLKAQDGANE
jgi:peptidoglycan hydrolase FlgJ